MKHLFQIMGVINITPNSFSDGGNYNHVSSFESKFNELLTWADVVDIGAESTAPFNNAVSLNEELSRFEDVFFPVLEKRDDPQITLSVDTYKASTFEIVAKKVRLHWPLTNLIWNDVSGVVDDELLNLLQSDLDFSYVLSHNLCNDRTNTSNHMNYLCEEDITKNLIDFFEQRLSLIKTDKKILLDPCFGFSKTREQNHKLLKDFTFFAKHFDSYQWVYGISRKSFLRFPQSLDSKNPSVQNQLDQIQNFFLVDAVNKLGSDKLIFRVHNETSKNALNSTLAIIS